MKLKKYILNFNGEPVEETDLFTWGRWLETNCDQRRVGHTLFLNEAGEQVRISTVFLGLDHNYGGGGPPILWETMVFGGPHNGCMSRCAGSREQAEAMHAAMVEKVRTPQPVS